MFGHHGRQGREEEEEERWRREEEERLRWEREKHQQHHHHHDHQQPHHHSPFPPPATSGFGAYDGPPPPPYGSNVQLVSHEAPQYPDAPEGFSFAGGPGDFPSTGYQPYRPPPFSSTPDYAAPPPPAYGSNVQHVSHDAPYQPAPPGGPSFSHFPPIGHHQSLSSQKTYRIYPKAGEGYSLTIRNGQVLLAKADHRDEYQHWIKDEKYSTKVKDEQGYPAFSLVNKVTGEAIKHSIGQEHPVRLVQYNPDYLDESVLWTESKDVKHGFRSIRMVNNIKLAFDAFHGDVDHGGVHDGTTVVLWEPWNGDNQIWKITPY